MFAFIVATQQERFTGFSNRNACICAALAAAPAFFLALLILALFSTIGFLCVLFVVILFGIATVKVHRAHIKTRIKTTGLSRRVFCLNHSSRPVCLVRPRSVVWERLEDLGAAGMGRPGRMAHGKPGIGAVEA